MIAENSGQNSWLRQKPLDTHQGFYRLPTLFDVPMVAVAKWLTHRIVIPTYVGSIPISHPISFPCFQVFFPHRGVAQLVARVVWDHEVAGSNPVTPTIFSGPVRAPSKNRSGTEFESVGRTTDDIACSDRHDFTRIV